MTDANSPASPAPTMAVEHHPPRWAPLTIAAWVGLVACTNVANAVWSKWVVSHPERVLALSSRNRFLALCLAAGVPLAAYAVIATVRLMVAFGVCHLVGRAYGPRVLGWFQRFLGANEKSMQGFLDGYEKGQYLLVPIFVGSNLVGAISGIHRTSPKKLISLLAVGIAGRLVLLWWLARRYEDELQRFLRFLQRYQLWFLVISIGLVVVSNIRNFRRGR